MKVAYKRILISFMAFLAAVVVFTVIVNNRVESLTNNRIYESVDSVPHRKVALLLGTNPLNRYGRSNSYFMNRIRIAADLYHAGKVDYIIASGDNHIKEYDEPTAMRDSLMARGVPENRIILDFAGFRTLDSVVRAKEVFGCDSLTIVSQADHCARALYLAGAHGIDAVAIESPVRAGRWVRIRLALREWLARDKMMLDLWFGKRPHFLGEKIDIPDVPKQKCRSSLQGVSMKVRNLENLCIPVDSIVVDIHNDTDLPVMFGTMYRLEKLSDGKWIPMPYNREYEDGEIIQIFNAIGYIYSPHSTNGNVNDTRPSSRKFDKGIYRLTKHFSSGDERREDSISVEFEVR